MQVAATHPKVDVKVLVVCREWAHWGWLRVCLQSGGIAVEPGDVDLLRSVQGSDLARFDVLLFEAHDLDDVDLSILQRARETSPLTEVVAISAGGRVDDAVQALRSGVYAILLRPVSEDELVRTILAASERKRRAEGRMRALGAR
ncbi:MAG: hypothetical protein HY898_13830 [Deltaproteobacteria bacterium]|nr:hypothetical protein [Deltaproteobacteria bacterium]